MNLDSATFLTVAVTVPMTISELVSVYPVPHISIYWLLVTSSILLGELWKKILIPWELFFQAIHITVR